MALKENYKDDILDVSVNTKRKYRMTENADGTISLDDETVYSQEGDSFGASDINAITEAVNNNSGMPVGTIATFDGTTLPSGFEPYQTEEQRAIAQINDNLSGFKFYPTGTQLVAYIEGHGWYNTDGKYVIWGTATANALVEASPNTYYGRPSEEDLRGEVGADTAIPFSKNEEIVCQLINEPLSGYSVYGYGDTLKIDISKYESLYICMRGRNTQDGAYATIKIDGTTIASQSTDMQYIGLVNLSNNNYLYIETNTGNGRIRLDGIIIGYKRTPQIVNLPFTKYFR